MPTDATFADHVSARVREILADTAASFGDISPAVDEFFAPAFELTSGGKRMRARLMATGVAVAQGSSDLDDAVVELGAALELFQAAALVHDDIIDDSDSRRGKPATHVAFAQRAPRESLEKPEILGKNSAILLGDLLIVLADQAATRAFAGLATAARQRCVALWSEMTSEVAIGQYLDVLNSTLPIAHTSASESLAAALRVVRHKSARYSVEHPLTLGVALGGGDEPLIAALARVGLPLGEAFQLRDDDLGVFGDPAETGKPAGDDLREGKRTPLLALTRQVANESELETLETHLGNRQLEADLISELREIIERSGARAEHEKLIQEKLDESLAALADANVPADAAATLTELAHRLAHRTA